MVHSEHPVLNWRRREDSERWIEFGRECSREGVGQWGDPRRNMSGIWESLG